MSVYRRDFSNRKIRSVGYLLLFWAVDMFLPVYFSPFTSHEAWDRIIVGTVIPR
jgi:hypothetical protein